jgi:hypothetical protein
MMHKIRAGKISSPQYGYSQFIFLINILLENTGRYGNIFLVQDRVAPEICVYNKSCKSYLA